MSKPQDKHTLSKRREELLSKAFHDPAIITVLHTSHPPPFHALDQVPIFLLVQEPSPQPLNRLKDAKFRTILKKKIFSTDGIVDRYQEVWNTIEFHMFEIFTIMWVCYISSWICELYAEYGMLVPKEKKKVISVTPMDHVMVWERRVKYSSTDINEVIGWMVNVIHVLVDQI